MKTFFSLQFLAFPALAALSIAMAQAFPRLIIRLPVSGDPFAIPVAGMWFALALTLALAFSGMRSKKLGLIFLVTAASGTLVMKIAAFVEKDLLVRKSLAMSEAHILLAAALALAVSWSALTWAGFAAALPALRTRRLALAIAMTALALSGLLPFALAQSGLHGFWVSAIFHWQTGTATLLGYFATKTQATAPAMTPLCNEWWTR